MCDETFALNYSATIPNGIDRSWFMFWVSFLNYVYWVSGAAIGGLLGNIITFNTKGLSFVMTSMFLVIFLEQWKHEKKTLYGIDWSFLKHCLSLFLRQQFFHYPVHGAHAGHHYFIQETY